MAKEILLIHEQMFTILYIAIDFVQSNSGWGVKKQKKSKIIPWKKMNYAKNHEYFYLPFLRFIIFCLNYF